MMARVVEVADEGRHIAVERGFLVAKVDGAEVGRVPLDQICAVVFNAHGLTCSANALNRLSESGIPVVLCGSHHRPVSLVWPVDAHHAQALRMRGQLAAGKPLQKRLWQSLIKAKIGHQAAVVDWLGERSGALADVAGKVRSGDPDNLEGYAARRYWPLVFGSDFRRTPEGPPPNGLLNYGYAILRAATARAVMAAGLHPTPGIHHRNRENPMCLVDDLMEPFRPWVDALVVRLTGKGWWDVEKPTKGVLGRLPVLDLESAQGTTPLFLALERLAASLAHAYDQGRAALDLPRAPLPLDLAALDDLPERPDSGEDEPC